MKKTMAHVERTRWRPSSYRTGSVIRPVEGMYELLLRREPGTERPMWIPCESRGSRETLEEGPGEVEYYIETEVRGTGTPETMALDGNAVIRALAAWLTSCAWVLGKMYE